MSKEKKGESMASVASEMVLLDIPIEGVARSDGKIDYDERSKAIAMAALDAGYTPSELSVSTGIPERTLYDWRNPANRSRRIPARVHEAAKEELAAKHQRLAHKMLDSIDAMDANSLSKTSLSQRATAAGIFTDKKINLERGTTSDDTGKVNVYQQINMNITKG